MDADSVRITRLSVPRVYVLDNYHRHRHQHQYQHQHQNQLVAPSQRRTLDDPELLFDREPDTLEALRGLDPAEHLVLDCEYAIEPHEQGFVLKWLHNDVPVYQWIPPHRSPSSLQTRLRDHVNRTYTVNGEPMHKHRALALMHPCQELAGKYTCYVQTYTSIDRQSADLFIIVPESSMTLKYHRNPSNLVTVVCSAYGIFPAPELSLWVNDYKQNSTSNEFPAAEGLFDSSVSVQLVLYETLGPDDVIKCTLEVPGTDYRRTKETVFVAFDSRPFGDSNSILDPFGSVPASSTSISRDTPPSSAAQLIPGSRAEPKTTTSTSEPHTMTPSEGTSSTRATTVGPRPASTAKEQLHRPQEIQIKEFSNENLIYNSAGARLGKLCITQ
ncbi:uncharacterized protein LOC131285955 [Anopheles ziemanni]|uniref:uncharacterized protein LOC131285955 n=1 Tax=Anopheles ziemanni TaxID=345580 RepID=UPI00265FAF5C|nr:uncharacterized protein LOC131285955 [Anopheles ziemanni]